MPVYCGWDQPAYVSKPLGSGTATWRLVADDYRCTGDMPVTTIHWWGSYAGWDQDALPRRKPDSWRIAFWSNVRADTSYQFSRPGRLLWLIKVPADRVLEERVGSDQFPRKASDTAYQYLLELQEREYFLQVDFVETHTTDRIFWISITAVYTGLRSRKRLGLEDPAAVVDGRRRQRPMSAAVSCTGITPGRRSAQPITDSTAGLDQYDGLRLATNPEFIKWEQAFSGLRNWPH
jgi:hypothetical protein